MTIAIVEDEPFFMQSLQKTLLDWKPDDIIMQILPFYTGEEIVKRYHVERIDFDIVFIDIQLDGINGIEVAKQLRKLDYGNAIVFTTNHKEFEFMQQGYGVSALHYFAKPVTKENIESCMELLEQNKKYSYYYNGKPITIPYKEILWFDSKRNYIHIQLCDPDIEMPDHKISMPNLLKTLPNSFIQCHRSIVVNMTHVLMIEDKSLYIRNINDPLPIGDKYLNDVLSTFNRF